MSMPVVWSAKAFNVHRPKPSMSMPVVWSVSVLESVSIRKGPVSRSGTAARCVEQAHHCRLSLRSCFCGYRWYGGLHPSPMPPGTAHVGSTRAVGCQVDLKTRWPDGRIGIIPPWCRYSPCLPSARIFSGPTCRF